MFCLPLVSPLGGRQYGLTPLSELDARIRINGDASLLLGVATMVEYAILLALITTICFGVVKLTGSSVKQAFQSVSWCTGSACGEDGGGHGHGGHGGHGEH